MNIIIVLQTIDSFPKTTLTKSYLDVFEFAISMSIDYSIMFPQFLRVMKDIRKPYISLVIPHYKI